MDKIKKVGKLPLNARITIDYTKEKPKIKFGYPRKDVIKQAAVNPFVGLFTILIFVIIGVILGQYIKYYAGDFYYSPNDCNVTIEKTNPYYFNSTRYSVEKNETSGDYYIKGYSYAVNSSGYVQNITISCDNNIKTKLYYNAGRRLKNPYLEYWAGQIFSYNRAGFNYSSLENAGLQTDTKTILIIALMGFGFMILAISSLFIFIGLTRLVAWILIKIGLASKLLPYFGAKLSGRGYYAKFTKVDSKVIEIPMFNNFKMDYNATEDFSKYLQKFEIREHPYHWMYKKHGKFKKKKNVMLWNAKFYFSEVPKTGKLEVWFK